MLVSRKDIYEYNEFLNRSYSFIDNEDISDQNIYFLTKVKGLELIKQYYTVVDNISDADIIFCSHIPYITSYEDEIKLTSTNLKCYSSFTKLMQNNQSIKISYLPYNFNTCSDKELTQYDIDKLRNLLSSDIREIFNLGWQMLWNYNYDKYKNEILILIIEANEYSFKNRTINEIAEFQHSNWKKLFKNNILK